MTTRGTPTMVWTAGDAPPAFAADGIAAACAHFRAPAHVIRDRRTGAIGVGLGGYAVGDDGTGAGHPIVGSLPPLYPEWLGDRAFGEAHGVRFPYVAGEMANGIASARLVVSMAGHGLLAFFGAAGLSVARVGEALGEIERALGSDEGAPAWGANLIHSPAEPAVEDAIADLYIRRRVRIVCASAFMNLTPAVVRCAASGLARDGSGRIVRARRLFAKISRPEVAEAFMSPAPPDLLDGLVRAGQITAAEAELARTVPVAEDITVEADSGGHTDNRPLGALFPIIQALRDDVAARHRYLSRVRVGAAGGLGTPSAVASAFALGAAYVVTGTVNQSALEAGLSADGKRMLAQAGLADTIMAPAADMFEQGVKVQVLRRGTMFGVRALRLYELYRAYDGLEAMPADVVERLERDILGHPCAFVWKEVQAFFASRDPSELERAARDPKHRMALVFRWYLGLSSRWAIAGDERRRADYQIWCGPAMGAFNRWVKGSFLESIDRRTVVQIALNLLEGAAAITRAQQLRNAGVAVTGEAFTFAPRPLAVEARTLRAVS
jgi:trans-AT polyketide synthase, acyltransferase and oxidoreductase domains